MPKSFELIWFGVDVVEEVLRHARQSAPLETGGALLGYRAAKGTVAVVTSLIGPGPEARHKSARFSPDLAFQHAQIVAAYAGSQGVITYLGDWHTHPCGSTALSRLDKRAMRLIAESEEAHTPYPLMFVAGSLHDNWTWAVWQMAKGRSGRREVVRVPTRLYKH